MKGTQGLMVITSCHYHSGILRLTYQATDDWMTGRLQCLKKKLQKDEKFHTDYTAFMDNLFKLAYKHQVLCIFPIMVDTTLTKPIRMVFDGSSEFPGRSLNKKLFSGPDFANQTVGVLLKVWENEIALMANIELIYNLCSIRREFQKNIDDSSSFYGGNMENTKTQLSIVKWMYMFLVQHHHLGAIIMPWRKHHLIIKKFRDGKPQRHYVETSILMTC